nr:hypothetical protein NG677_17440 [Methylobacterium sp. OTU13CASTA1]
MSGIVPYALRTCLGQILLGTTLAEDRIFDSAVQPIEELVKAAPEPFIVISTDDEEIERATGWALLDAERTINIVVEIAVGGLTKVEQPVEQGGGQALQLDIPQTDEGLETTLNMIGRQVYREILIGGPWSDLFRDIAFGLKKVSVRRGANTEQGLRFAARQYVFQADTMAEPEFGTEPEGAFARLLAMMEADAYLAKDAPLVRQMIIGDVLPEWRRVQADYGLTDRSYRALGLGPLFTGVGEPLAQRFTINGPRRTAIVEAEAEPAP